MYKWATLLSKGPKVTVMHFSFKVPLTSLISNASYFNLGIEAFSEMLSSNGTGILDPCDSAPPQLGGVSAADTALAVTPISPIC